MILRALAMEQVYWTESALLAIGRTMNHEWDSTVLEYFSDENPPIILAQAVHAAGLLGIYSARRPLFRMLNLDTDYDVRQEVIWALSQIGGDEVIERLEHFANITDDEDEIELIEDSIEYLELFGTDDPPELAALLNESHFGSDDDDNDFDSDDDDDFFKIPMDMEEWERYVNDDDFDDEEDEFSAEFDDDEDDEDIY